MPNSICPPPTCSLRRGPRRRPQRPCRLKGGTSELAVGPVGGRMLRRMAQRARNAVPKVAVTRRTPVYWTSISCTSVVGHRIPWSSDRTVHFSRRISSLVSAGAAMNPYGSNTFKIKSRWLSSLMKSITDVNKNLSSLLDGEIENNPAIIATYFLTNFVWDHVHNLNDFCECNKWKNYYTRNRSTLNMKIYKSFSKITANLRRTPLLPSKRCYLHRETKKCFSIIVRFYQEY